MRVAASAVVTVLVAGALSACSFVTPQQTDRSYTPSDGVNGNVGDVQIRNVTLIAGTGDVANMLGVLANTADSPATVTLQYGTTSGTESTTLSVPANGVLSLRPNVAAQESTSLTTEARDVELSDVTATPGALFNVSFATTGGDPVSLQVPVLNGALSEYSSLVPTLTPSASDTVSDSPAPSETAG